MKCINCGAELNGNKCEYCGSEYNADGNVVAEFGYGSYKGILKIDNHEYDVYIGRIDYDNVTMGYYRDEEGRMVKEPMSVRRIFTLIQI